MAADHRHPTDQELLQAIDNELPPGRRIRVEDHVAVCRDCRLRHRRFRLAIQSATMAFRQMPAAGTTSDPARSQLDSAMKGRSAVRPLVVAHLPTMGWLTLAAAVVIGLVIANVRNAPWTSARTNRSDEVNARPIAAITPGATWELTLPELCGQTTHELRDVPPSVRQQVVRNYHVERISPDDYELDYLITPELGGAPDARNLWPQWYTSGLWNARVKDQLETLLPQMVCNRQVALEIAQRDIARDWIAAYKKYFKTDTPIRMQASAEDLLDAEGDRIRYPVWRSDGASVPRLIAFSPGR